MIPFQVHCGRSETRQQANLCLYTLLRPIWCAVSKGIGGATITFTWYMSGLGITGTNPAAKILSPTETNADGTYSVSGSITRDSVIAHYAGDNEHSPAKSKMIVLKRE
jgi:hypothetical protein